MAEALYRKYRPQVFEDVVGQDHIERTLKNAIGADKVSHAYLFTGPRGTGKTTTARLLAKALLCESGPTPSPDGTCAQCSEVAAGTHPDVYELDAASRTGVENVREEIIGRVNYAPTRGRYKVYIVDEVHMLSTAAFNALLKTLEEPPSHVVFILCTTDAHKVPETIQSRCQRFDFRRISNEEIVSRLGAICLEEGVEFEGDALELVASRAEGGMRNALTSLEQLITFGEGTVTMQGAERMLGALDASDLAEIVRAIGNRNAAACFRWTAEYLDSGADLAQFAHDLAERVRTLYVLSLSGTDDEVVAEVSEATRRELADELPLFGPDRLARMLGVLGDLTAELRSSTNPRLSFEIALTRMVRPDSDLTLAALAERIEALERALAAGGGMAPAAAAASAPAAAGGDAARVAAASERAVAPSEAVAPEAAQPAGGAQAASPAARPAAEAPAGASAQPEAAGGGQAASAEASPQPQASGASAGAPAAASQDAGIEAPANVPAEPAQGEPVAPAAQQAAAHEAASQPASAQPAAAAGAASGLENPATLQRLWQQALATLKKAAPAHGVLFIGAKATYDAASGQLQVAFPAENEFAFNTASKPDVQAELQEAVGAAFGAPVALVLTRAEATASSPAASQGGAATAQPAAGAASSAASQAGGPAAQPAAPAQERQAAVPASSQPDPGVAAASASNGAEHPAATRDAASFQPTQQPAGAQPVDAASAPSLVSDSVPLPDDFDQVPLDVYEDIAPWEDAPEPSPSREVAPDLAAEREPAPNAAKATPSATEATAPEQPMQAEAADSEQPASAVAGAPSADAPAPDPDDLNAMLAFGFGEGATFTEVTE